MAILVGCPLKKPAIHRLRSAAHFQETGKKGGNPFSHVLDRVWVLTRQSNSTADQILQTRKLPVSVIEMQTGNASIVSVWVETERSSASGKIRFPESAADREQGLGNRTASEPKRCSPHARSTPATASIAARNPHRIARKLNPSDAASLPTRSLGLTYFANENNSNNARGKPDHRFVESSLPGRPHLFELAWRWLVL